MKYISIAGYPETKSRRQQMQEKLFAFPYHILSEKDISGWRFEEDEKKKELKITPAEPL